ncbi:hypothetical protein JHK85_035515 [Glycine max]|nr:hypothetical protein JHK85_035515 [Glycine max]
MAEQTSAAFNDGEPEPRQNEHHQNHNNNKSNDTDNERSTSDPELFCCLLQPATAEGDPEYIGIRRLLLSRKAEAGVLRRRDWRCNGKTYVAYRNYISRPRNWERDSLRTPSLQSTPGNSGRWFPSPTPHGTRWSEVDSLSSGRDLQNANPVYNHRTSFGSSVSDSDRPRHRGVEAAYSFVGMHCIFDQCKASVTVLKFGHMSSDLLAYGASDGTLTVCSVSENPSVIKQLNGHSKDVFNFSTGRVINRSIFDSEVTSMDHDHTGHLLFCGDAQGCIYSVNMNSHTGVLSRSHRYRSSSRHKSAVTTVQYRSFSLLARGPGHRFPVMGIAWNHGENLLASSDFYGIVIVWKRERSHQKRNT